MGIYADVNMSFVESIDMLRNIDAPLTTWVSSRRGLESRTLKALTISSTGFDHERNKNYISRNDLAF